MYTTTEKLLLVYAVNFFGLDNETKIKSFLKARSFDIDLSIWRVIYDSLLIESNRANYSNLIEYCEDVRYSKLIECYKEKYEMRNLILEDKMDPNEYLRSIQHKGKGIIERQDITKEEIDAYYSANIKPLIKEHIDFSLTRSEIITKLEIGEKSRQVPKPRTNDVQEDVESLVVVEDVASKQNKRYYQKMNEQEREFDDFIDTVDDYFYYKSDTYLRNKENPASQLFPVAGKVKNIDERRELLKKEIINPDTVAQKPDIEIKEKGVEKKKRSVFGLEKQYRSIEERVSGRKNGEKEKLNWFNEIKVIISAIIFNLDKIDDPVILKCKENLKNISEKASKDGVLSVCILNVLMVVQNLMFIIEDELFSTIYDFKKVLISFYDYYRK